MPPSVLPPRLGVLLHGRQRARRGKQRGAVLHLRQKVSGGLRTGHGGHELTELFAEELQIQSLAFAVPHCESTLT